ncbi:hypothetical protein PLICRDRAFT_88372 [Plicaturopsis crispa FD-325 SS-3]|nr:hypothetical protein PLICRDRAFT_88372 [Plicaturopsis crispa FD-325 SS-3]
MSESAPWRRPWWLGFLDRTNLTVTGLTACVLLYTKSSGVLYFCVGGVACSMSVKLIKRFIRQPRPAHPSQHKISYGMPSTHSATITYYASYIPLACAYLPIHTSLPSGTTTRIIPPLIVVPWAGLIAMSRVWLGHHTWLQVIVGCSYGLAFASVWFALWTNGLDDRGRTLERMVHEYL